MGTVLDFRILGPFEVVDGDRQVTLGGPRQRALLAMLLLRRGEAVSSDRLISQLWAERPPMTAAKIVQGYVSQLRKAIGDDLLLTRVGGYVLAVAAEQVDADRFEQRITEGRRSLALGDDARARDLLCSALELWRGEALADMAYESFAQAEIVRLEELKLGALEDRIDADLKLGTHRELVGELDALAREHPGRERLLAQLMLGLYRSGRQSEALSAYRRGRQALSDELGLEPGSELRVLEQRILNQDPALDLTVGPSVADRGPDLETTNARQTVRGRRLIAAGAALLLAAAVAAAVTESIGASGPTVRVGANSVAAIDVSSNTVAAAVAVGAEPGAITFGSGALWVANVDDQTVSRVDPHTLQTLAAIPLKQPPTGIAATDGSVWAVTSSPSADYVTANRIDPRFNSVDRTVRVANIAPTTPAAITARGDTVLLAPYSGEITQVSVNSGAVLRRVDPNASPSDVAFGDGAIWVTDKEANELVRIDPTGLTTSTPVGDEPEDVAVGAGGVWVADTGDDQVKRIDPRTDDVTASIPVGREPLGLTVGAGSVWVANSGDGTVSRIDPRTARVIATIQIGGSPQAITVAAGKAWVTVDATVFPHVVGEPGGTLRLDDAYDVDSMDPALAYGPLSWELLYATCAKLLNYPDRSGPASSQLVPEVARALPARSADGRTYTFTIRRGFRFAPPSGQTVTAQTFKDTIERTLNPVMKSPVAGEFENIAGARAYMAGKARHITGVKVDGDRLIISLNVPEPDFLERFAQPFFCAVPLDTPVNPDGVKVIPSAGPYTTASYVPGQGIVLVRNPNYHGDRPHRFARIDIAVDVPGAKAVSEVEHGTADYAVDGEVSAAGQASLAARYGFGSLAAKAGRQQYFVNAQPILSFFVLNTHRPLFSHQRLREAVNYAINRTALDRLGDLHSSMPDVPADENLPPGIPGHRIIRVYPPTPDLSEARKLAKGFAGSTVVLYTCERLACAEQAAIVKTDLAAIGLRVDVKTFGADALFSRYSVVGEPFDMGIDAYSADYPDPDDFLNLLLDGGGGLPSFLDPSVQRQLAAAARLNGVDRYLTYARLDQVVSEAAPFVVIGDASSHNLFSARIGCQVHSPYYGIDLAAICVRKPVARRDRVAVSSDRG
jgi:YVTN family beta-propeller protein